jgi:uncharacterized membrane protein
MTMGRIAPALLCLLALSFPWQAQAQNPEPRKPAKAGAVQEVQEIQEVKEVSEVSNAPAGATSTALIGRMHPAIVHFPIAWISLALLLEILFLITKKPDGLGIGLFIQVLAALSFVPAAITGLLRASAMGSSPEFLALMVPHRNLNLAAGALFFLAVALRIARRNQWNGRIRGLSLALIALATMLLMIAGHLGGKMVFGAEFLSF